MKKMLLGLLICFSFLTLTGCDEKKEKVYTYHQEQEGIKVESTITIQASGDVLDKTVEKTQYTFSDVNSYAQDIEDLKKEYESYKACPGGLNGSNCSQYIDFKWSMEGNVLTSTETIHYEEARDANGKIYWNETLSKNEYYSLDKTVAQLEKDGYKEKE